MQYSLDLLTFLQLDKKICCSLLVAKMADYSLAVVYREVCQCTPSILKVLLALRESSQHTGSLMCTFY